MVVDYFFFSYTIILDFQSLLHRTIVYLKQEEFQQSLLMVINQIYVDIDSRLDKGESPIFPLKMV